MKKIISSVLALVILLAVPVNCLAATGFVNSITYKPAPDIVIIEDDGKKIIGYVRDEEGNIISTEHKDCAHEDCIIITPISEAKDTTEIPRETADSLMEEYEKLKDPSTKLSEVCEGLDEKVKKETNGKYGANDMVIRDMFNITEVCENIKLHLPKDGYVFEITFDIGIGKNEYITAMIFKDGKWVPIQKMVNNGDGTVTCYFQGLGHIAFLVPSDSPSNVPATGDTTNENNLFLWGGIMVASLGALIVIAVISRRSKSKEK